MNPSELRLVSATDAAPAGVEPTPRRHALLVSPDGAAAPVLRLVLGEGPGDELIVDQVEDLDAVPAVLAEEAHELVAVDGRLDPRAVARLLEAAARAESHPPVIFLPVRAALRDQGAAASHARRRDRPPADLVEEVFRHALEGTTVRRALRESESRFAALAEAVEQGVLVLDPANKVRLCNPAAATLLGWGADDAPGRDAGTLLASLCREDGSPFPEGTHPLHLARWRTWAFVETTVRLRRADGSDARLRLRAQRLTGTDAGSARSVLVLLGPRAGTDRPAVEPTRPPGGIVHDLNNLLHTIQGHVEMLRRRLAPHDPGAAHLDAARRAVERAAVLLRELRGATRPAPRPARLDLNAFLQELEPLLRHLLGPRGKLELELAPGLGTLDVDRAQLEQVVMNLATNARDAMPLGGRLRIETRELEPDAGLRRGAREGPRGRALRLTVADTGCGMDEGTRQRAFQPYFTTKPSDRGTGLGLAVVQAFVRQAGGAIDVTSSPGAGARFEIDLPCG